MPNPYHLDCAFATHEREERNGNAPHCGLSGLIPKPKAHSQALESKKHPLLLTSYLNYFSFNRVGSVLASVVIGAFVPSP